MTEETIIPKGPKGLPYFGSTFSFASPNRLDWMASLLDKHGDVFSFKMMNRKFYMINHPDYVKEILATKMSKYSKESGGFRVLKKVLGESVFTASGDVWKRKRTLVQPQFHKKKINQLAEVMTSLTDEMLNRWEVNFEKKEPVDIKIEMMNITLGVVTRAMFGEALSDEDFQKVVDVFTPILQETNMRLLYPFKVRRYFNKKGNQEYKKNIEALDDIIYRIIDSRRNTKETHSDLLQMLMDARTEDTHEPLSNEELRDEVMTVFIAGHETTANALSWFWITLSEREDIYEKLKAEVDDVLGDRTPGFQDFMSLKYIQSCFKETLRYYPPVPLIGRKTEEADQLGAFEIEDKSIVMFSPYFLHRHPDFWDNAEEFIPERFESEDASRQHPFAYLPFGGGPRICVGFSFAYMEAAFIIAMVMQRFRLKLPQGKEQVKPLFEITLRPEGDVLMNLERSVPSDGKRSVGAHPSQGSLRSDITKGCPMSS